MKNRCFTVFRLLHKLFNFSGALGIIQESRLLRKTLLPSYVMGGIQLDMNDDSICGDISLAVANIRTFQG